MPCLKRIFGHNLRQCRREQGLTQEALAELLNVTSHSVSNMERGVHGPRFATIELIVQVLETDAEALFRSATLSPIHRNST